LRLCGEWSSSGFLLRFSSRSLRLCGANFLLVFFAPFAVERFALL